MHPYRVRYPLGLLAAASVAAACGDDAATTEPVTPSPTARTVTVDATAGWVYVDLASGAPAAGVTAANAATSPSWDIAFNGTATMLNGGQAGPGGVKGFCVCQNSAAGDTTAARLQGLKADAEAADFVAVGASAAPGDTTRFRADSLSLAFTGWYSYDPATRALAAQANKTFAVRLANGTSIAKVRVAEIANASQAAPGRVTLEYAVLQAGAFGAARTQTFELTSATSRAYVDLSSAAPGDASRWDLMIEGYRVRVNGGASAATAAARAGALALSAPFAAVAPGDLPPSAAFEASTDRLGGVFEAAPWYRYNVTGTDHQIWPTYDVYLVRRAGTVYKVQVTGYYSPSGAGRHITFRSAKIAG